MCRVETKKPGAMGLPHYSLDGLLQLRNQLENSKVYQNNHKDIELIRSNSEKVRACISSLKNKYGYK